MNETKTYTTYLTVDHIEEDDNAIKEAMANAYGTATLRPASHLPAVSPWKDR
jgi:hypothetical protein